MTEPTDEQLNEIVESGEDATPQFQDSLLYLETGAVLVSRVITNLEDTPDSEHMMVLYKPAELVPTYEGDVVIRQWLAESDDDYFMLPMGRVITVANPKQAILEAYLNVIGVTKEAYLPEGETLH